MNGDREEFHEWVEEFIYQFGKTIDRAHHIDTVTAYIELQKLLDLISTHNIDTPKIRGLHNKAEFDRRLTEATALRKELGSDTAVPRLSDG